MIDINLPLASSENNPIIGDEDLIKAINKAKESNEMVTIDYSDSSNKSSVINFSKEESRYNFLQEYFNSSMFEVLNE